MKAARRRDDARDELYTAPLSEFVARRKAVAARLRERGRMDEAKAVAAVGKPRATVWALNRIARTEPKVVARGATTTARGALAAGTLTDAVSPAGFELFAGATPRGRRLRPVTAKPAAPPPPEKAGPSPVDLARRRAARGGWIDAVGCRAGRCRRAQGASAAS